MSTATALGVGRLEAYEDVGDLRGILLAAIRALPAWSRSRPWLERARGDLLGVAAEMIAPLADGDHQRAADVTRAEWVRAACAEARHGLPAEDDDEVDRASEASTLLLFACAVAREAARSARAASRRAPLDPLALDYLDALAELLYVLTRLQSPAPTPHNAEVAR